MDNIYTLLNYPVVKQQNWSCHVTEHYQKSAKGGFMDVMPTPLGLTPSPHHRGVTPPPFPPPNSSPSWGVSLDHNPETPGWFDEIGYRRHHLVSPPQTFKRNGSSSSNQSDFWSARDAAGSGNEPGAPPIGSLWWCL